MHRAPPTSPLSASGALSLPPALLARVSPLAVLLPRGPLLHSRRARSVAVRLPTVASLCLLSYVLSPSFAASRRSVDILLCFFGTCRIHHHSSIYCWHSALPCFCPCTTPWLMFLLFLSRLDGAACLYFFRLSTPSGSSNLAGAV